MTKIFLLNAAFEAVGSIVIWLNVVRIRCDRTVKGSDWRVTAFYSAWGVSNLFYYPAVGDIYSAFACSGIALGNITWVVHALYYMRKRNQLLELARSCRLPLILDENVCRHCDRRSSFCDCIEIEIDAHHYDLTQPEYDSSYRAARKAWLLARIDEYERDYRDGKTPVADKDFDALVDELVELS